LNSLWQAILGESKHKDGTIKPMASVPHVLSHIEGVFFKVDCLECSNHAKAMSSGSKGP